MLYDNVTIANKHVGLVSGVYLYIGKFVMLNHPQQAIGVKKILTDGQIQNLFIKITQNIFPCENNL